MSNTTISNNHIVNNGNGVVIVASLATGGDLATNVNIVGNTISGNRGDGVLLRANQNKVIGNDIYGNGKEVVDQGFDNAIQGNNMVGNGEGAGNIGTPPAPSPSPTTPPSSFLQAAVTLFVDGLEIVIDQLEGYGNADLAAVNANIALNLPYAGPFADWFVLAGEAMAKQFSGAK